MDTRSEHVFARSFHAEPTESTRWLIVLRWVLVLGLEACTRPMLSLLAQKGYPIRCHTGNKRADILRHEDLGQHSINGCLGLSAVPQGP